MRTILLRYPDDNCCVVTAIIKKSHTRPWNCASSCCIFFPRCSTSAVLQAGVRSGSSSSRISCPLHHQPAHFRSKKNLLRRTPPFPNRPPPLMWPQPLTLTLTAPSAARQSPGNPSIHPQLWCLQLLRRLPWRQPPRASSLHLQW